MMQSLMLWGLVAAAIAAARFSGKKMDQKVYHSYSGYPGGLREMNFDTMQKKHPEDIVTHAVKGMLPNGRLGRSMLKKLKVYVGPTHEHAAQKPETWTF